MRVQEIALFVCIPIVGADENPIATAGLANISQSRQQVRVDIGILIKRHDPLQLPLGNKFNRLIQSGCHP